MWLATTHGFYSIVRKKPADYHVRGRTRKDIENLLSITGLQAEIHEWPLADYRYRVIVGREGLIQIMTALVYNLTYSNFKNQIARTADQREKLDVYHDIWATMAALQSHEDTEEQKH